MSHSSLGALLFPCPVLQLCSAPLRPRCTPYRRIKASNGAVGVYKSGRDVGRGGARGRDRCAWVPDRCLGRAPDFQHCGTDVPSWLAAVLQREGVRRRGGAVSILYRPTARCCNGAGCSSVASSAIGVCWLFPAWCGVACGASALSATAGFSRRQFCFCLSGC